MTAAIGSEDIKEIRLYGALAKKFGKVHRLAVKTAREATMALAAVVPGFKQHMIVNSAPGYHVFVGKKTAENSIGADLLDAPVGKGEVISVVPVVAGSKSNGVFQVVIGIVLVVAGILTANPMLIKAGIMMTLSGIIQMLTPVTRQTKREDLEQISNYHFDGPVNQTREGAPIQVTSAR